jgi:hypothetical protein
MIKIKLFMRSLFLLITLLYCSFSFSQNYCTLINERPPQTYRAPIATIPTTKSTTTNVLDSVPAYIWTYGCCPTAFGMLIAYYALNGYPDLNYTQYFVPPMNNSQWGISFEGYGEDPLIASHEGYDSRSTRGHVDDYYVAYGSTAKDPFITGNWTEHTQDCIADYLGSNQWNNTYVNAQGNTQHLIDGGTLLSYYMDGTQYTGSDDPRTCEWGIRDYIQCKNYVVSDCYTQVMDGYNDGTTTASNGFTFQDFQNEIDNGRPVIIQLIGHTMLGIGYSTDNNEDIIYVNDTWDYNTHQMNWGGTYSDGTNNLQMFGVTVVHIKSQPGPPTCIGCTGPGTPNAPTLNSVIYNSSNNYITLSWTPSSGSTSDYYSIYRCLSTSTMTNSNKIANTSQTSYKDFNFISNANISYTYAVAGVNDESGEGANSNQMTVSLSPCSNTNVLNTTFTSNNTIGCNNIKICNVSINNNSSVTFNYGSSLTINSDFSVGLGSSLIIRKQ